MGMEDATKNGQAQEFFYKKLQRRPGQPTAELVNVFVKAVLNMKATGLNVELKSMGLALFRKEQVDSRATRTCVGTEFAAIRRALIQLFPDDHDADDKRGPSWHEVGEESSFTHLSLMDGVLELNVESTIHSVTSISS